MLQDNDSRREMILPTFQWLSRTLRVSQTFLAESEHMKPGAEDRLSDAGRQASPREGRARRQTTCAISSVASMTYQQNKDEAQKRISNYKR